MIVRKLLIIVEPLLGVLSICWHFRFRMFHLRLFLFIPFGEFRRNRVKIHSAKPQSGLTKITIGETYGWKNKPETQPLMGLNIIR